jgi:hypothetical protein
MRLTTLTLLIAALPAFARQDPPKQDPAEIEFQKKVDAAIDKGVQFLLAKYKTGGISEQKKAELILLTLIHAGLRRDHPFLVENMNKMLNRNLNDAYNAGLRGLLLEKVDRKLNQRALAELAMFFVDSQCENGQWTYTGKSRKIPGQYIPVATKRKDDSILPGSTRSDDDGIPPGKPIKLPPPGKASGVKTGDDSNTQYAILALFAAARANVEVPKSTWEKCEQWFESKQNSDGGWGYQCADVPDGGGNGIVSNSSSGSMTTAGLTAMIVCKFYLGKDWKADPKVQKGLSWLGSNLSYSSNPGGHAVWHYYYLYGLERVGQIAGMKEFGGRDWYKGGADWLLSNQKDDGRWEEPSAKPTYDALADDVVNTCFAILFLRRATPELKRPKDIASEDVRKKDAPPK